MHYKWHALTAACPICLIMYYLHHAVPVARTIFTTHNLHHAQSAPCSLFTMHYLQPALFAPYTTCTTCTICTTHYLHHTLPAPCTTCTTCTMHSLHHALCAPCTICIICTKHYLHHALPAPCTTCTMHYLRIHLHIQVIQPCCCAMSVHGALCVAALACSIYRWSLPRIGNDRSWKVSFVDDTYKYTHSTVTGPGRSFLLTTPTSTDTVQ